MFSFSLWCVLQCLSGHSTCTTIELHFKQTLTATRKHSSRMRTIRCSSSTGRGGGEVLPNSLCGQTPSPWDADPPGHVTCDVRWEATLNPMRTNTCETRMHSSRVHTARSSSRPGGVLHQAHPPRTRHPPPVDRITDRCKHITLPQTSFVGCNNGQWLFSRN